MVTFRALLFVASLVSGAAFAQQDPSDIHVVYDVRATVIRHIPDQDLDIPNFYSKGFHQHKIPAKGHYYLAAECAVDTIRKLAEIPGVKISFLSEFDESKTSEVVRKLGLDRILYRAVSRENLAPASGSDVPNDGSGPPRFFKDLTKVTRDLSNAVMVTPDLPIIPKDQDANTLKIGPNYYYYESYEKSVDSAIRLSKSDPGRYRSKKPRFPVDAIAWRNDRDKFVWQFGVLVKAIAEARSGRASLMDAVRKAEAEPREAIIQSALSILGNGDPVAGSECLTRYQR